MPKPTPLPNLQKVIPAALLSVSLLVGGATGADASDGKAIGLCLLGKQRETGHSTMKGVFRYLIVFTLDPTTGPRPPER